MNKPRSPQAKGNVWAFLKPLIDAIFFTTAFLLAYWVRYHLQWFLEVEPEYRVPLRVYGPSIAALTGVLLLVYWIEGAYRQERGRALLDELYIVFRSTLIGISTMIVFVFLATPSYYSRLIFGYTGVITLFLIGGARVLERVIINWRHRHGKGIERVLIVGIGEVSRSVMRAIIARPEMGYRLVGFVDDEVGNAPNAIGSYPSFGTTDALPAVIHETGVDKVIIALPWVSPRKILRLVRTCEDCGVQVRVVPDLFQMALRSVVVDVLDGIPLLGIQEPTLRGWERVFKRVFDLVLASALLIVTAPLFVIVALAIKLDSPGPVIFRQVRVGRGNRHFVCFKFRTMCVDAEARLAELRSLNEAQGPIFKMRDDPRCTRVGRFLRRTSLDELPQLWNVIRGEMSLVGPRPPIPSEVAEYEPWHLRRLEVSPGITGLWQVSGRSDLSFDEMVLLDIYYIENWSPLLDLRILLKTIPTVLWGKGAY